MPYDDSLESTPAPTRGIKVRRMDLGFTEATPEFWFDGNPFLTSLLNSMSVSFPPGERYFIHSVRHFLPQIVDPVLRDQVRAFAGQEANHTKEHLAFNRFLDGLGYPALGMERFVERRIEIMKKRSTPAENLARTVALEHFTAILASAFVENPDVLDTMSPEATAIWAWHAIEEIEHKSVAFDVYKATVDDDALRMRTMALVTVIFTLVNVVRTAILMNASGNLLNVTAVAKGMNVLWAKPGVLRNIVPRYLSFYRSDFHPSQHDDRAAVAAAKKRYLGELD